MQAVIFPTVIGESSELFSNSKHYACHLSLNNCILSRVTEVKDLGVIFASNTSFSAHIDAVVKKSLRMLGFVRQTGKGFYDINVLKTLFNPRPNVGPLWFVVNNSKLLKI